MWGAKSGVEQLPPFPEPSHDAKKWKLRHCIPLCVKDLCVVDFQTATAQANALAVVCHLLLGCVMALSPDQSVITPWRLQCQFGVVLHYPCCVFTGLRQHALRRLVVSPKTESNKIA